MPAQHSVLEVEASSLSTSVIITTPKTNVSFTKSNAAGNYSLPNNYDTAEVEIVLKLFYLEDLRSIVFGCLDLSD